MDKHNVSEFQVLDHGEDGSQYFPGCGTSFTHFSDVATGVGDTGAEALEDALEQMAMCNAHLSPEQEAEARTYLNNPDRSASAELDHSECDEDHSGDNDWHHYVSVRYNVKAG